MNTHKRISKLFLLTLLAVMFLLAGCMQNANANTDTATSATEVGTVSAVTVTDQIQTSGSLDAARLTQLTWKTSGSVEAINVRIGDKVKAGEVLAQLRADSVPASLASAQADLITARRNLEDAQSSSAARAKAQLALVNAQTALTEVQSTLDSYKVRRGSSSTIEYYEAQVVLAQKQVDAAQAAYDATNGLADDDPKRAQATTNLYNAKKSLATAQANVNWFSSQPSSTDVALAEANLAVAQANLDDAQRSWERLKDGPDPANIAAAQAKVDAAQANLNSMYLIAPFDGEVIAVNIGPGDLVNSGNTGIIMVDRNTLRVAAQVDETDIAQVALGNAATVTMDALPEVTLTGKVVSINPIGATVSGLVKYMVNIALDPTDQNVLFGATTDVTLLTSAPREMLAVPIGAVQNDSQGEYVLRVNALGGTERVEVVSDSIQDEVVAVTGDLKVGDQVVVTIITTTSTNNQFGPGGGAGGGMFIP